MSAAASSTYAGHDLGTLADIPNYQEWIVGSFRSRVSGQRVIEIGAGIGSMARLYAWLAREVVLLEPAGNLMERLRENLRPLPNAKFVNAILEDVAGKQVDGCDFSSESFDAAVMINVLEHIEDDGATLRTLRSLLRPGGWLIVFVPALSWLFGSLDEVHFHKRRYSARTLGRVARDAGFDVEILRYFDVLGVIPWFVAGRVMRQREFNGAATKLYDRVVVPLGARLERLVVPPLGKNLLCIARRI